MRSAVGGITNSFGSMSSRCIAYAARSYRGTLLNPSAPGSDLRSLTRKGSRPPNETSALDVMSPGAFGRLLSADTIFIGSSASIRSSSATGIVMLVSCARTGPATISVAIVRIERRIARIACSWIDTPGGDDISSGLRRDRRGCSRIEAVGLSVAGSRSRSATTRHEGPVPHEDSTEMAADPERDRRRRAGLPELHSGQHRPLPVRCLRSALLCQPPLLLLISKFSSELIYRE